MQLLERSTMTPTPGSFNKARKRYACGRAPGRDRIGVLAGPFQNRQGSEFGRGWMVESDTPRRIRGLVGRVLTPRCRFKAPDRTSQVEVVAPRRHAAGRDVEPRRRAASTAEPPVPPLVNTVTVTR